VLPPGPGRAGALAGVVAVVLVLLTVAGCSAPLQRETTADRTSPPKLGDCYRLTPKQTSGSSSDQAPVSCSAPHTAQTFAVGSLPASTGKSYSDAGHGRWIYPRCQSAYEKFLSFDESMALRVQLSWAWFRPSEKGWDKGARWYRCDLVGGSAQATSYRELPVDAQGLFRAKPPEQWLTCAQGETVLKGKKVPCTEPHDWRAVTTIKLGETKDAYPGDRLVQVRSRDFCSDSVGAWMNYPVEYAFGYTWFHEAEWKAGNRRSVCWARTNQ
jgi:Septum formation